MSLVARVRSTGVSRPSSIAIQPPRPICGQFSPNTTEHQDPIRATGMMIRESKHLGHAVNRRFYAGYAASRRHGWNGAWLLRSFHVVTTTVKGGCDADSQDPSA